MFDRNITDQQLNDLYNANVVDQDGDKIGKVGQVYFDDETGALNWVTASTGFFGTKETFVPVDRASLTNGEIRVPYSKSFVKDAPRVDADQHISAEEEAELYRYYSMEYADRGHDAELMGGDVDVDRDRDRDVDVDRDRRAAVDVDRDRGVDVDRDRTDDGSVIRREEELRVGKERVATGRMRLRKHVVTEQKTVTVPVEREEYTLEREPIADGDRGGRLGDDEVEVTTYEERPVVQKDVVDKERVGLHKDTVREDRQVTEEVAREEVEVDRDGGRTDVDVDRDRRDRI